MSAEGFQLKVQVSIIMSWHPSHDARLASGIVARTTVTGTQGRRPGGSRGPSAGRLAGPRPVPTAARLWPGRTQGVRPREAHHWQCQ